MGAIRADDGTPAGMSPPSMFLTVRVVLVPAAVFLPGAARRATS